MCDAVCPQEMSFRLRKRMPARLAAVELIRSAVLELWECRSNRPLLQRWS